MLLDKIQPKRLFDLGFLHDKKLNGEISSNLRASFTHYLSVGSRNPTLYIDNATTYVQKAINYQVNDEVTLGVAENELQYLLFNDNRDIPFPPPTKAKFQFIDLFAGIGGIRMAFQNLGGECIFSSEWDIFSQKTYEANYGELPFGDLTKEETKDQIPNDFDVLCAGFPCQAFSIAGKRGGFDDIRGTMFFEVANIIKKHQPKAFFLENVKGLLSHDKGKTLATILNVLRNDLGYFVPQPEVINAKFFGVPQNRERIYIIGYRKDQNIQSFKYPKPLDNQISVSDILEKNEVSVKYYLSNRYLDTLIAHKERHANKGNGFGYEIIQNDGIANAVVCGGMGRERNLLIDNRLTNFTPVTNIVGSVNRKGIRKMTPREWARLQGFPDTFKIVVSDAQAYKQFGNSVAVPAVQATAKALLNNMDIN
ncbi:MAG: DNA cytosine methyltransferase [Alteromonadaceae bacterium]|nr:DNA cytosine methyltransferase [Alteromonadaceae bacterium]